MKHDTSHIQEVIMLLKRGVMGKGKCSRIARGSNRMSRGLRIYISIGLLMWAFFFFIIYLAIKAIF